MFPSSIVGDSDGISILMGSAENAKGKISHKKNNATHEASMKSSNMLKSTSI